MLEDLATGPSQARRTRDGSDVLNAAGMAERDHTPDDYPAVIRDIRLNACVHEMISSQAKT